MHTYVAIHQSGRACSIRHGLGAVLIALSCMLPLTSLSGPVKSIVFAAPKLTHTRAGYVIVIPFNYPVEYVTHYPDSPQAEVVVRIRLLEANALEGNLPVREESAQLGPHLRRVFEDIRFDGTIPDNPKLVLRFRHSQHFTIRQGGDWRSIVLYVYHEPRYGDIAPPEAEIILTPEAGSNEDGVGQ